MDPFWIFAHCDIDLEVITRIFFLLSEPCEPDNMTLGQILNMSNEQQFDLSTVYHNPT